MDAVMALRGLPATDKLVLLALAYCENHLTGDTHPSVPTLARLTGLTGRGVQKALRRLEEAGHLLTVRGDGRTSSRYKVTVAARRGGASGSPQGRTRFTAGVNVVRPNKEENPGRRTSARERDRERHLEAVDREELNDGLTEWERNA